jgi:hypothetical protein
MHFLVPISCGTKLQIDLDLSVPVADAKARNGPTLVTECLPEPEQPSCVMVRTVAVHVDVTAGAVALLHI